MSSVLWAPHLGCRGRRKKTSQHNHIVGSSRSIRRAELGAVKAVARRPMRFLLTFDVCTIQGNWRASVVLPRREQPPPKNDQVHFFLANTPYSAQRLPICHDDRDNCWCIFRIKPGPSFRMIARASKGKSWSDSCRPLIVA